MNFFLHFQMVQTSWIFFRNSPQKASGALACRALSNRRQSPVLAGCQNGKTVLAKLLSISLRLEPKKALLVATPAVCLLQETLAHMALAGQGMFGERGCCSFDPSHVANKQ